MKQGKPAPFAWNRRLSIIAAERANGCDCAVAVVVDRDDTGKETGGVSISHQGGCRSTELWVENSLSERDRADFGTGPHGGDAA